jgi:uncharacterized membrane protein
MKRSAAFLLSLFVLFAMLALPVVAQDGPAGEPAGSAAPAASGPAASEPAATGEVAATAEATPPPFPTPIPARQGSVVQAVFFFSPSCGHCEYVITNVLPGLFADNGGEYVVTFDESVLPESPAFYLMSNGRLQLLMVDTTLPEGGAMFKADSVRLGMDQPGVPRLDFEDTYLVGSGDIPDQFPDVVKQALAGDGIAWPDVPGLAAAIASFIADGSVIDPAAAASSEPGDSSPAPLEATAESSAANVVPSEAATGAPDDESDGAAILPIGDDGGPLDRIGQDPVGNGIAIAVLIALVVSLIAVPLLAARGSLPAFPGVLVPVLALIGIGVSAYLASIETSGSEAVCGPVGDCNAVQESQYAELLGIPIGVLGIFGYLVLGALWVVSRVATGKLADWALLLIALGAFGGTLFSAYLTFLEPFVIGATCMWCITSALVMLALLWLTAAPGRDAFERIRGQATSEAPAPS